MSEFGPKRMPEGSPDQDRIDMRVAARNNGVLVVVVGQRAVRGA
jgi:hypothetical protein